MFFATNPYLMMVTVVSLIDDRPRVDVLGCSWYGITTTRIVPQPEQQDRVDNTYIFGIVISGNTIYQINNLDKSGGIGNAIAHIVVAISQYTTTHPRPKQTS